MKAIIISVIFIIAGFSVKSQTLTPDIITTSGEFFTNSYATLSLTIGEIVTETVSNSNNTLTQGFQQSQYITSDIEEKKVQGFAVNIFPNPTKDLINIDFDANQETTTLIQLCDENGKILIDEKMKVTKTNKKYKLKIFATGIYFLRITSDKEYSKTVKIIKN